MQPPFDPWRSASAAAEVQAATRASPEALAALQAHRLAGLLAWTARASPLYRDWTRGHDPARLRLQDLPIVRKPQLMAEFDRWVTDPGLHLPELRRFVADPRRIAEPFQGRYVVWESSGSSGEPGVFVQDAAAMAVYDALEALRRPALQPMRRLLDPLLWNERIAFVGATGGHFASVVSVERLRRLNPVLAQTLRSVSFLQPVGAIVAELNAMQPSIVATYPTAAVLLAEERQAGRLTISPHEVWTGGEGLTPRMRAFVQQAFECPVCGSYGASEFLALASECACGRLHLNTDWAVLEPVDAQGRAVPAGQPGHTTLLTNLANRVQPLIRYDLGDRVTLAEQPCDCGSALPVVQVQGRCDESLRLGDPAAPLLVLPLAVTTVLEDEAGLYDFQLAQQGPRELLLSTPLQGAQARDGLQRGRSALAAYLAEVGAPPVRIHCRTGFAERMGRSGKRQRVLGLPSA